MCVTSYVGDYYRDNLPEKHPWVLPVDGTLIPGTLPARSPTQAEFDALKKEVEELKKLLLAAKRYDEETGERDCEMDAKIALIKEVAKLVGVDMDKVFK